MEVVQIEEQAVSAGSDFHIACYVAAQKSYSARCLAQMAQLPGV